MAHEFRHPSYYKKLNEKMRKLTSSQAGGDKLPSPEPRVQASSQSHKLKNLMTRVQAHKPTIKCTSNKDKGILFVLHVEGYLVG